MSKLLLTQAIVNEAKCESGRKHTELCDTQVPGLMVYISASQKSAAKYLLRAKNSKGTNEYLTIGTTSEVSLSGARKLALQLKQTRAESATSKASDLVVKPAGEMTLDVFMRDHYFPHAFLHKRSAKKDEQLYRLHIGPVFKNTKLSEITRRDVQAFHNALLKKGQSPASADHSLKLMKRVINLCVQWEFLDRHVLKGVPLFSVSNMVTTYLVESDVARLVEVLRKDSNRPVCNLLLFLISIGVRRMSGQLARWDELDLENRVWKIPATKSKSKRPVSLPLNDSAMHILQQLDTKGKYEYVFVNPKTGKPFTTITRVWYRLRKKAGLADNVRMHDLRHYFASALSLAGVPAQEISLLMTHADSRSVQRYLHVSMPRLQQSANRVSILTPPPVATITQIGDAANTSSVIVPRALPGEAKPPVIVAVRDIAMQEAANDVSAVAPTVEMQEEKPPVVVRVAIVREPATTVSINVPAVVPQEEKPPIVVKVAVVREPPIAVSMIVPRVEAQEPKAA